MVLSELRDTMGLIMLARASTPTGDWSDGRLLDARSTFIEQKIDSGHIRKVKGNSYTQDLTCGNAIAGISWCGDISSLDSDTDDPARVRHPGVRRHALEDNMMVPISSPHRCNAES